MNTCFLVKGKPFFPIGGEVHNSSTQSEAEMENGWKALELLEANTVEAPLHWELIEPSEGNFDFSQVDRIVYGARKRGIKVILLWFGTWKNGKMEYTPAWVKQDTIKFQRVITYDGVKTGVLSCHCEANLTADRRAFCAVMQYVKKIDATEKTVIGMQVENEAGNDCRTIRDYSSFAETEYVKKVPADILEYIRNLSEDSLVKQSWLRNGAVRDGNWKDVFGCDGAEFFTAAGVARYINEIARAGKQIYDIPMIINVWNSESGYKIPGLDYPAGGAGVKVFDLWRFLSPDIDIIGPDIYLSNPGEFSRVCSMFHRMGNPVFIPESPRRKSNEWALFQTIARHNAVGYFMFGIEDILHSDGSVKPDMLTVVRAFTQTSDALPLIIKHHGTGSVQLVLQEEGMTFQYLSFKNYNCYVSFNEPEKSDYRHRVSAPSSRRGAGLVIQNAEKEFFCIGGGYCIDFIPVPTRDDCEAERFIPSIRNRTFLGVEEGFFDTQGKWHSIRTRNGDLVNFSTWIYDDNRVVRIVLD